MGQKGPWLKVDWSGNIRPEIIDGPVPQDALWSPAQTTVLTEAWWPENFGHALGDDYFPLYRLARAFNRWSERDLGVIFHPSCHQRGEPDGWEVEQGCKQHGTISSVLLDRPIEEKGSSELFRTEQPICFKELLVGTGSLRMGHPSEASLWVGCLCCEDTGSAQIFTRSFSTRATFQHR